MWKWFNIDEMKCKHCGECKMQEHFMGLLDSLRTAVGQPLTINSGYRCPTYDASIGGEDNHTQGLAADIKCETSGLRFLIVFYALSLGFKRIGIAKTFIHLDLCGDKPKPVVWLY